MGGIGMACGLEFGSGVILKSRDSRNKRNYSRLAHDFNLPMEYRVLRCCLRWGYTPRGDQPVSPWDLNIGGIQIILSCHFHEERTKCGVWKPRNLSMDNQGGKDGPLSGCSTSLAELLIQRWDYLVLPWDVNIGWLLFILPYLWAFTADELSFLAWSFSYLLCFISSATTFLQLYP